MEETELSEYATIQELGGLKQTETNSSDAKQSERKERTQRRILRIALLTVGVLCILQVTLNITLHLAFSSKEETDPFSSSMIEEVCHIDQSQQISTQFSSCCNKLLRKLLMENEALKRDRDVLQEIISQLTNNETVVIDESGSGSGSVWI